MIKDKAITEEAFNELIKQPAIDYKAIGKYERSQKKVLKRYNTVDWTEIIALDTSIIRWLYPRLIKLKEMWEKWLDIKECEIQKLEYEQLIEFIFLSNYILEEKWYEEIKEPTSRTAWKDMFIKMSDKDGNTYTTLKEPTLEEKEYYEALRQSESKATTRYLELLNILFWRLGY